ncbi:hypothetical protein FB45DRAFT_897944 [Roridomyces roridus]|uniref:Uncharacterized protein n=1 Tax=Roridomyces roridus TaxID=1738132 RepID=A0AAD7FV17_9AGAR|nr:hypothetical protein FB45DRAFT_897944 [Roridomyces roridus]
MATTPSVIHLSPPSAVFVATRTTTLGPWVSTGAFLDCVLMGVIFCQALTFYRTRGKVTTTIQHYYQWLVAVVLFLSMLKTAQVMAVVWVQNVLQYANPDVGQNTRGQGLTGIIGVTVQSFFCLRFFLLSNNWLLCVPIVAAMCLGLAGVCLSLDSILANNTKAKVMWLLVRPLPHQTTGIIFPVGSSCRGLCCRSSYNGWTIYSLQVRNSGGLERTTQLINRLLRLVFESAFPPTFIAMMDLILTQTLGKKLLVSVSVLAYPPRHVFVNTAPVLFLYVLKLTHLWITVWAKYTWSVSCTP